MFRITKLSTLLFLICSTYLSTVKGADPWATPFSDNNVRMSEGWRYIKLYDVPNAYHGAIDYVKRDNNGLPIQFEVRAIAGGYAARLADGSYKGLGNVVMIVHVNERSDPVYYTSLYAHVANDSKWQELPLVKRVDCPEDRAGSAWLIDTEATPPVDQCNFSSWERVRVGEHIANAGSSGGDYATHLHMEVYNSLGFIPDDRIDPYDVGPGDAKNLYEYTDCGVDHMWFECPLTTQSLSSGSFPIRDNDSQVILIEPDPPGVLMFGSIATAFTHENLPELGVTLTDSTGIENTVKALGNDYCWPGFGDLGYLPCNNASVSLGNTRLGKPVSSSWAFEFIDTAAGDVGFVTDLTVSSTTHKVVLSTSEPPPPPTGLVAKDIWTTSVFSYAPGGGGPGGGLDNNELRVGGWGDYYHSLIQFDLSGLPDTVTSARIELFAFDKNADRSPTGMWLDRVTEFWDWRTQGTGSDNERLWWADRPNAVLWSQDASQPMPAPTLNQWYSIDITNLYNEWKASGNGIDNFGVQFRPVSNFKNQNFFYSSDYADDPTLRPKLVIVP